MNSTFAPVEEEKQDEVKKQSLIGIIIVLAIYCFGLMFIMFIFSLDFLPIYLQYRQTIAAEKLVKSQK